MPAWGAAVALFALALPARAEMPWREAGLSERQAAAHLLNRFAYGPRPGEIDRVIELGLGNWVEWQLQGDAPRPVVAAKLARLGAVSLSPDEIDDRYPHHNMIIAKAVQEGIIAGGDYAGRNGRVRQRQAQAALVRFAEARGYQPRTKIFRELRAQKIYRAIYAESQLVEVMTDFWFNHFYVSASDSASKVYVLAYERDAIRRHALASFRALLWATARHPAMLIYLDNASSRAEPVVETTFELAMEAFSGFSPNENPALRGQLAKVLDWYPEGVVDMKDERKREGLNENYARELLELHTLGVDGGYTQDDVIEVARALIGWGFAEPSLSERLERLLTEAAEETNLGFVIEDEFMFRADHHDAESKSILGVPFPAGRGIEDGEEVLELLVRHPSTAHHLAYKLAVRFVSDHPPRELVARLARAYELSDGNVAELVREFLASPEFWSEGFEHSKLKSPFELAISALRTLDAEVDNTGKLESWIARAGQPLYAYVAPTSYPDRPETWSSTGSLLSRINFLHALARGRIPGITFDLRSLIGEDRRPDDPGPVSVSEAMRAYLPVVLTEKQVGELLEEIADGTESAGSAAGLERAELDPKEELARLQKAEEQVRAALAMLLGSPEFQRR